MNHRRQTDERTLSAALIGAAAGAAAVWVMDRVDWFNYRHEDAAARRRTQRVRPGGMDPAHVTADKIGRTVGCQPARREHNAAGVLTHYAIGVGPAIAYSLLRRDVPGLDAGRGAVFGLGLFAIQDEGLNAIAGLSARPRDYPWQAHSRGLVAHLVYGVVLDAVLRAADGIARPKRSCIGR